MTTTKREDLHAGTGHPGQQTDTGTGHGVKGQGGQEDSKGVPVPGSGERGRDDEARERRSDQAQAPD